MSNPRRTARAKTIAGTLRADREPRTDYTARLTDPPPAPLDLTEKSAEIWNTIAAAAAGLGTLTAADLPLLNLLVSTLTAEADARATLASEEAHISRDQLNHGNKGSKAPFLNRREREWSG